MLPEATVSMPKQARPISAFARADQAGDADDLSGTDSE